MRQKFALFGLAGLCVLLMGSELCAQESGSSREVRPAPAEGGPDRTVVPVPVEGPKPKETAETKEEPKETGTAGPATAPPARPSATEGASKVGAPSRGDEHLKGSISHARTDQDVAKDKFSGLDQARLIDLIEQYRSRYELALARMQSDRQAAVTRRREPTKSASVKQLEASIEEAKRRIDQIHPELYKIYPGEDIEAKLNLADMFFGIGRYKEALQQYLSAWDREKHMVDDSDRSWTLFQIGQCEMLLTDPQKALSYWDALNTRFKGDQPTEQIENKFRSFEEDPEAVQRWSTGFWRRHAAEAGDRAVVDTEVLSIQKTVLDRRLELQTRARQLIPDESLQLHGAYEEGL